VSRDENELGRVLFDKLALKLRQLQNSETPFTFNPDHKHVYRFLVQVEIPSGAHFCQCDGCKPDKQRLMMAALCSGLDPVRALIPQGCTVEVRAEP